MKKILILLFSFISMLSFSQKNITTLGIQVKPIVPSKYFDTGASTTQVENIEFNLNPKLGYNFGMVIRKGMTKNLSIESGISIVRRNYNLQGIDLTTQRELNTKFAFVGYEIPVQALFYIQLGEGLWMNAAGGMSFDFYPSNIYSNTYDNDGLIDYELEQSASRVNWMQFALITNLGIELRTKENGFFYLGTSFHQQINRDMAVVNARYTIEGDKTKGHMVLKSNYLTLDFRYFFNEKPEKRNRDDKRSKEL